MKQSVKKYHSLFLLSTFLFAYTEKGIHDIIHADDVHCHVLTEKHFHNAEHHCPICDFEFPWYNKAKVCSTISFFSNVYNVNFAFPETKLLVKEISARSSRAPPSVA
ncbi:MAG: hypothetical protein ACLQQ4_10805 [Bacteroidia bacterium]